MKKYAFLILLNLIVMGLDAQHLEVEGRAKISVMDKDNMVDSLVVRQADGTLAVRDVSSITYITKSYVDSLIIEVMNAFTKSGETFTSPSTGTVMDIDGNSYKTVKIGSQWWTAENLRTTKYNEGTAIPLVTDNGAWSALSTPGYCWYDTTGTNYSTYSQDTFGALYNYYAVGDTNSLNVCPCGWHVPNDTEWTTLITFLGGSGVAGGKMKETGTTHWNSPNIGATNESGFSGLPGGFRSTSGLFGLIGRLGGRWSSTESSSSDAWYRDLFHSNDNANRFYDDKKWGFSVRCVRD